jgi:radical SAM superfamily enzyme YgiQ (UPF0313 family)
MKPVVYLADLRHNYAGAISTDCMPLGIGYIKAVMDATVPDVESYMFAYPDQLLRAIQERPPDVLMCSNYVWNEQLSLHFCKVVKAISPRALTILGGPNISIESDRQSAWIATQPDLDVYVLGEADFVGAEVVKQYLDCGLSVQKLADRELPSCIYRRADGSIVRNPMWKRHYEVDEIPSPFLTGIQDVFFDGKLAPMIETNRGCPFKCTFCVQGTDWYTKVHYFSLDRVKEELSYIARQIKERSPAMGTLRIADSNYGMFERDIEISAHIGKMQRETGWPTFIDATTGKNRPDRILKSVEESSGALVLYQAVQSLDENVLRNIKRQNIKLEAYEQIHIYMRGRGLRSNSDLILGLPGETLASHTTALNQLIDRRVDQMHNLQLLLLKGSEMETIESRNTFSFDSRFRLGPKNFGVYGDRLVFDWEEIVVATDTLSFEDYITSRKYHLISSVFWNDSWFEDAFRVADQLGIARSKVFHALLEALESSHGETRSFLDSFVYETTNELFSNPEELLEFYSDQENFEKLLAGAVGDNLMYKYRALASFNIWPDICRLAMDTFGELIRGHFAPDRLAGFTEFWEDFHAYVQLKHAHGDDIDQVVAPASTELRYDIPAWIRDGYPVDHAPYRLREPVVSEFRLTEVGEKGLRAAFQVWTRRGMSKLVTRIQMAWQVRECVLAVDMENAQTVAAGK